MRLASSAEGIASLCVTDPTGRVVQRFREAVPGPGALEIFWDGRDALGRSLPRGVYFAHLTGDRGEARVARLILVR